MGTLSEVGSWPENIKTMFKYFCLQALYDCSVNINATLAFFVLNLSSLGCIHIGLFSINEEQKKVGS